MDLRIASFIIGFLCSSNAVPFGDKTRFCITHNDCGKLRVCRRNTCRKIRSVDELFVKTLVKKPSLDQECQLSSECPSTYICNSTTRKCEPVTVIGQIMTKQKCNFKSYCSRDSQCACKDEKMVCRQNECVYAKYNSKGGAGAFCRSTSDCSVAFTCTQNRCEELKGVGELLLVSFPKKCLSGGDCKADEICEEGLCRPIKNQIKLWMPTEEPKQSCVKHIECPVAYICENKKCREAETLEELMMQGIPEGCKSDNECGGGEYCSDGECKKRKIKLDLKSVKCTMVTFGKRCRSESDCSKCGRGSIGLSCTTGRCTVRKVPYRR